MAVTSQTPPTGAVGTGPTRPVPAGSRTAGASRFGDATFGGFSHIFLLVWALMVVYPMVWVVMSAFKDDAQIIKQPLSLIPNALHWDNFGRAWVKGELGEDFRNTVVVVGFGVVLTMLFGSMAAYVLARYQFWGNRLIYFTFLAGLTLPIYFAAIPLFKGVTNAGVLFPPLGPNQFPMIILVYVAWSLSFTVFFMHSFFKTLPSTVAEAAYVDGASHTQTFFRVMLPMARPGLISIGIFNVLGQWNQWYFPTLLMQPPAGQQRHWVLTQGLIELSVNQGYKSDWSGLFAGVAMAMLPVLVVYIVFQRQVQSGLTAGITK